MKNTTHLFRGGQYKSRHTLRKIFLVLSASVFFAGCDNFIQGSLVKDEILKAITYANAPSYKVRVVADVNDGQITIGSGIHDVKVSDSFDVGFQKKTGKLFVKWVAVSNSDESVSMADYVTFEPATELETKVTLIKESDDIKIVPLCEDSFSPTFAGPVDSDEGVPRDSTIKLDFTYPLDSENDLSNITISILNSNVNGKVHFKDPEIVDKSLIIPADFTNRITVPEGETKTITVTIPKDFKYVGSNGVFEIGEDIIHSYRINSSTSDKTLITFGSALENSGTFKVNGIAAPTVTQQYSIGESITLTYKVAAGFRFLGWECSDKSSLYQKFPEGDEYDENGFNESTQTATTTLTIINESKNVTFTPVLEKIPTVDIKFNLSDDNAGTLKVNGATATGEVKTYLQGEEITLTFKVKDAYKFDGWYSSVNWFDENTDENKILQKICDEDFVEGYDPDTQTATIIIKVLDGNDEVIDVKPVFYVKGKLTVNFSSDKGSVVPSEEKQFYKGDKFELRYKEVSDYAFTGWKVLDAQGNELSDVVKFSANDSDVTVEVLKDNASILIKAECVERPKVVSATPIYDSNGVYRDRKIIVLFDNLMDESSIYWTDDELKVLGIKNLIDDENAENRNVKKAGNKKNAAGKQYYYAYKKDSEWLFKNIFIARLEDQSKSILNYYGMPVFDTENPRILRIPTEVNNPPPEAIDILVSIEADISYLNKTVNKNVVLGSKYKFSYRTNGSQDRDAPAFLSFVSTDTESGFRLYIADKAAEVYTVDGNSKYIRSENNSDYEDIKPKSGQTRAVLADNIQGQNAGGKALWAYGRIDDGGSGPTSLQWKIKQIDNDYYPLNGKTPFEINGQLAKLKIDGTSGVANERIDLETLGLVEGAYDIILSAYDANENVSQLKYSFIYDATAPDSVSMSSITNSRTVFDKETIKWTNPGQIDFDYIKIEREEIKAEGNVGKGTAVEKENSRTKSEYKFEDLANKTKYKYKLTAIDFAGNESEPVEWQDDIAPSSVIAKTNIKNSRKASDKETITWTKNSDEVSYYKIEQWQDSTKKAYFDVDASTCSQVFSNLVNQTKYKYRIYAVDYAENVSATYTEWQDDERPTALVNRSTISGSRKAANNETVSWSNPTGTGADEVSHIVIKQYYSITGTVLNDTFTQSDKEVLSNNFTGLTNQRKYEYRFYSVDYNGNVSSNYTKYEDTTGPAPVSGLYSDAGQYRVSLHFTTPSTEDFDHIEVYKNSSNTKETLYADKARKTPASPTAKSTKYMVRPDSYAGSSDTWKVYAVDFAGNKSVVSQITEGYAKPGMIVYQTTEKGEPIVSSNWYGNFYCVGVLYTVNDYINVARTASRKGNFVWDIKEYPDAFIWGKNDWPQYSDTKQHDDGKRDYQMIVSGYREQCVDYRDSRWSEYETVWHYLEQTRNKNNQLLWWLPAIDDYKTIIKYMDDIEAGVKFIKEHGGSAIAYSDRWYASSSVSNDDNSKSKIYELNKTSFPERNHRYSSDTWKDKPGYGVWHFMTEVPLD